MEWNSKIADKEMTIRKNTLNITDTIEEANSASFTFVNNDYRPITITQPVEIDADNSNKFKGYILNVSQTLKMGGQLKADIDCQGQDYLLKKRLITKAFIGEKVEDIVKYIIDEVLAQEGISAGRINAPAIVSKIAFNSIPCYNALDQLLVFGDYIWNIDNNKRINFHTIAENRAPYDLDFTDTNCIAIDGEYQIEQSSGNYRNSITLTGAKGLTPITEYFKGDGDLRQWTTRRNIHNVTGIWVDYNDGNGWTAESFAVNTQTNLNGAVKFLYNVGSNQVLQYEDADNPDSSPSALTADNTLRVDYEGEYSFTFKHEDPQEILIQKSIDGTSGINEVVEDVEIAGLVALAQYAKNNIDRNKKRGYELSFKTNKAGLQALQVIRVIIPQLNIDEDFLITSVNIYEDGVILYEVHIISGSLQDSYLTQLFGDKEKMKSDLETPDSQETANRVLSFEKDWTQEEDPNIFNSDLYPSNSLFPSDTLFPCYPTHNRVKFVQLYYTDWRGNYAPFLRVPIGGDEVSENGDMYVSTALIDVDVEFSTKCTKIGWIVSDGAHAPTATDFTSGIVVAESTEFTPFDKVKDLETITIFRVDNKWE